MLTKQPPQLTLAHAETLGKAVHASVVKCTAFDQ